MATSCKHGSSGARRAPLRPSKPAQNAQARGGRPVSAQRFRKLQSANPDRLQPSAHPLPFGPRRWSGSASPQGPVQKPQLSSRLRPSSASRCPEACYVDHSDYSLEKVFSQSSRAAIVVERQRLDHLVELQGRRQQGSIGSQWVQDRVAQLESQLLALGCEPDPGMLGDEVVAAPPRGQPLMPKMPNENSDVNIQDVFDSFNLKVRPLARKLDSLRPRPGKPRPASAPSGRSKGETNSQHHEHELRERPASAGYSRGLNLQVLAKLNPLRNANSSRPTLPASVKRSPLPCSLKWVELLEDFSHQVDLRAREDSSASAYHQLPSDFSMACGEESHQADTETLSTPPPGLMPAISSVASAAAPLKWGSGSQGEPSAAGTPDGLHMDVCHDAAHDADSVCGASPVDAPDSLPYNWWRDGASGHATVEADDSSMLKQEALLSDVAMHESGVEDHKPHGRSKEAWLSLFKKFAHDGEVHRDSLSQILAMGNVHGLSRTWLDGVWNTFSHYSTLDSDEFLVLVGLSEQKYNQDCVEAFKNFDTDHSGYIDRVELAEILASLNVTPMQQVLKELLAELGGHKNAFGDIDLEQYKELIHLLRKREGFSKQEYDRMLRAFSVFDRDGSDSLDVHEIIGVNGYLYYSLSSADVVRILKDVDVDGSGSLSRTEFLVYMRKVRELEVMRIEGAISWVRRHSKDRARGTLKNCRMEEPNPLLVEAVQSGDNFLESFLRHLGYAPNDLVLMEIAEDAGLKFPVQSLSLDSAWHVLEIFRRREGFRREDAVDIECAFRLCYENLIWDHHPTENHGQDTQLDLEACEIDTANACKALRWLGYASSYQVLQYFVREVDVDESGKLGIEEFKKLVRMYRERELQRLQTNLFKLGHFRADGGGKQQISKEECYQALLDLGCREHDLDLDFFGAYAGSCQESYDVHATISAAMRCRDRMRRTYRDNSGFRPEDVERLRQMFQHSDKDHSGSIDHLEVKHLFERMFGGMSTSASFRPKLLQMMTRAGVGATICFADFLRLVREFHDMSENDRLNSDQGAIMMSQFSSAEVKSFREIFLSMDEDCKDCLSFVQVKEMISRIVPLGDKLTAKLRSMWVGKAAGGLDDGSIDFPEFLMLMRRLLEANLGGIKEKTLHGSDAFVTRNRSSVLA